MGGCALEIRQELLFRETRLVLLQGRGRIDQGC